MDYNQSEERTQYKPDKQSHIEHHGGQSSQSGRLPNGYWDNNQRLQQNGQVNQQGNYQQSYQQGNYQQGNYQQSGYQPATPPNGVYKPDSGLVWAILTTLFCCLPFGIVSIVYASKVDSMWYIGNYQAAFDYAKKAKNWAMWAAIVGGVVILLYILFIAVSISAGFDIAKSHMFYYD